MARLARANIFSPDEEAIVHVMNRVVRRCRLMGTDPVTGKNYDHRKRWIEAQLQVFAAYLGIDLLAFAILDNHFHLLLRTRPDVVNSWDDSEVARRWLMVCPYRKGADGRALEPTQQELNSICNDPPRLKEIRRRLSDISWWMRLLCQRIAQRANAEEEIPGKFWESRFRAVRILDEAGLLACSAYIDLNPIRAGLAELLEQSQHTSIQRRIESMPSAQDAAAEQSARTDRFLAPLTIDEFRDALGPRPSVDPSRCSDRGYLSMSPQAYIELLDWTARQTASGKSGTTPRQAPAVLQRLGIEPEAWCELVADFLNLFSQVAGRPHVIDATRAPLRRSRFRVAKRARQLLATS